MTRAKNNAEARTRAGADGRVKRQRVAASVRLRICANVFARSRIHFDASLGAPARFAAGDVARTLARAQDEADEEAHHLHARRRYDDESTLH